MTRPGRIKFLLLVIGLLGITGLAVFIVRASGPSPELRAALVAIERRDFRAAADHLDKHLADHPKDVDARLHAIRTARRRGADAEFLKHIELHQQSGGSEAARAAEYRLLAVQQGDPAEGERLFQECLAHPGGAEIPLALEAVIEGALAILAPRAGQGWKMPAGADNPHVIRGQQAVKLWLESRNTQADQVQGLVWRGRLHAAAKGFELAVADFRSALEQDPAHFEARFQLAQTIAHRSPSEAAEQLRVLAELYPKSVPVRFILGSVLRTLGRLDEARKVLSEVVQAQPNEVGYLVELGLVDLDAGLPTEGERWLRKAYVLAPNDPQVNLALSRCMALAGRHDEAKKFQDRFQEIEVQLKRPWVMERLP